MYHGDNIHADAILETVFIAEGNAVELEYVSSNVKPRYRVNGPWPSLSVLICAENSTFMKILQE
jgi:hypothetical protein